MLTEFDQSTVANMTAALEHVCKPISPEKDSHDLRKQIGEAMVKCANRGPQTFIDFRNAGLNVLAEVLQAQKFDWFGFSRPLRIR